MLSGPRPHIDVGCTPTGRPGDTIRHDARSGSDEAAVARNSTSAATVVGFDDDDNVVTVVDCPANVVFACTLSEGTTLTASSTSAPTNVNMRMARSGITSP